MRGGYICIVEYGSEKKLPNQNYRAEFFRKGDMNGRFVFPYSDFEARKNTGKMEGMAAMHTLLKGQSTKIS